MMNRLAMIILMSVALLVTSPSLAAECNEDAAADFNSRIESNFTIMEVSDTQNVAVREKIEALRQKFSKASKLQSEALDSHDEAGLNLACEMYESILKEQAGLGE